MPTFDQDLREIRQAVYGRDVREAIADALYKLYSGDYGVGEGITVDRDIIAGDGTTSKIADHSNVKGNMIYRMQLTTKMSWLPSDYPVNGSIHYLLIVENIFGASSGRNEIIFDESFRQKWIRQAQPSGNYGSWYSFKDGRAQIICNPGTNTIQAAVDMASYLRNADVILKPGTYSITNFNGNGMSIGNGVRVFGHPDAVISALNSGTSQYFSPFYAGEGDFELDGVKITAKNVRYCVHDDPPTAVAATPARHIYRNCDFYIDNTENTGWPNHQCIGGGMGRHTIINIENCRFDAANPQSNLGLVSYHNNGASDAEGMIFIKDSQFIGNEGTARFGWYGESTKITRCYVVNCAMGHAPVVRAETSDGSSPNQNMQLITWNSGVAQNTYGNPVSVLDSVSSTSKADALSANMGKYLYGLATTAIEELNNGGIKRIPLPNTVTDLDNTNYSDYDQHFYISDSQMAGSLAHKPFTASVPAILDVYKLSADGQYLRQVLTAYDDGSNSFNRVYVRQKYYAESGVGWGDWQLVTGANGSTYVLPAASNSALGGVKTGYSSSGKNYAVQLDSNERMYVNVPWESGGGSTTVVDNLTSTSTTSALSANQGRVLNETIQNGGIKRITLPTSVTSLNDVNFSDIDQHFYIPQSKMKTISNAPFNEEIPAMLDVYKIDADGVYIRQVITAYDSGTYNFNRVYVRQKYYSGSGSVWGSWKLMPYSNASYPEATTSAAGLMSASDKTKLNGIASGATNTKEVVKTQHTVSVAANTDYFLLPASTKSGYSIVNMYPANWDSFPHAIVGVGLQGSNWVASLKETISSAVSPSIYVIWIKD